MDYAAFLQAAERGQPPAVALLHGADEQLLDDALDLVTRGLFADATERALGREVLEGEEVSVETVMRSAHDAAAHDPAPTGHRAPCAPAARPRPRRR